MTKIINLFLSVLKVILLIASFILTFYVVMFMYKRLDKNYIGTLSIFLPFLILFLLMGCNIIFLQRNVLNNLYYNLTCCLVFIVIIISGCRAIFDGYMLSGIKMGYGINFNYFSDMISPIKSMLFLLIAANVCLMFGTKKLKRKVQITVVDESIEK